MKHFILFCILHVTLFAQAFPQAYAQLAQELLMQQESTSRLKKIECFTDHSSLSMYDDCLRMSFEEGTLLEKNGDDKTLQRSYLKGLRACDAMYEKIRYEYAKCIRKTIVQDDYENFAHLLQAGVVISLSLKEEILEYYESKRGIKKIDHGEAMLADAVLEQESRDQYEQEYAEYEEHIAVLAKEEEARIRAMTAPSKRRNVVVSTQQRDDGYDFIAENYNAFHVTVTLQLKQRHNVLGSETLPYHFELAPKSVKNVLHVSPKDRTKRMSFQSHFSWIMGSAWAKHRDVLYRIPFAKGAKIPVSQGFNGKTSHRGKSAIDFAVDVGTPIYAARSGRVVAIQDSHHQGGFDKSYGKFANYIIIEHDDKTLANYYHLKQGGVVQKLGAVVKEGDLIAYSGNTGYSSGPHLHFSVSKVDPKLMNRPLTIPIRFKNRGKLIPTPEKGEIITLQ
jgi:murein DD-endopeptidase MepM/ murein hydrolase activator NlpD